MSGEILQSDSYYTLRQRLAVLCRMVEGVLEEVGCHCLARRLCGGKVHSEGDCCGQSAFPMLALLPKLAPLARSMARAGFYDTALACAEAANVCEQTIELELVRAFLYLILGETQEAAALYRHIQSRLGSLPPEDLAKLRELLATHSEEEDLAELYAALIRENAA